MGSTSQPPTSLPIHLPQVSAEKTEQTVCIVYNAKSMLGVHYYINYLKIVMSCTKSFSFSILNINSVS